MGYYINPTDCAKEQWLRENATSITSSEDAAEKASETVVPVCLVDNGLFTAAAVIYSEAELNEFASLTDPRPKRWFLASVDLLKEVAGDFPNRW